jgi:hypothetical protein
MDPATDLQLVGGSWSPLYIWWAQVSGGPTPYTVVGSRGSEAGGWERLPAAAGSGGIAAYKVATTGATAHLLALEIAQVPSRLVYRRFDGTQWTRDTILDLRPDIEAHALGVIGQDSLFASWITLPGPAGERPSMYTAWLSRSCGAR